MKRICLGLFFLLFSLSLLWLYEPVLVRAASFSLKGISQGLSLGELSCKNIYRKDGFWIIEKPSIHSPLSLERGGHSFNAELIKLQFNVDWREREVFFDFELVEPSIFIGEGAYDLKDLFERPVLKIPFFSIRTKYKVVQGDLAFIHSSSSKTVHALFNAEISKADKLAGTLNFWGDDGEGIVNQSFISLRLNNPEYSHVKGLLSLENTDCSGLLSAFACFYPQVNQFQILQGKLNGNFDVSIDAEGLPALEGEATISGLVFSHPEYQAQGEIPEAKLALVHDGEATTFGHFEMVSGSTIQLTPLDNPPWVLQQLRGNLFFQTRDGAKLVIEGLCYDNGKQRSVKLEGNARLNKKTQSSLSLSLVMKENEGLDTSFSIFARQTNELWNFALFEVSNCGLNEFSLFQGLFKKQYPLISQIHLKQGSFDATLHAHLQESGIIDFAIEKFAGSKLEVDINPWEVSLKMYSMVASLSLDLAAHNVKDSLNVNAHITEGMIRFASTESDLWQVVNVQSNLIVRKGVIQKSVLKGKIAGLDGSVEVDLSAPDTVMQMRFSGGVVSLDSLFPNEFRKAIQSQFDQDKIEILVEAKRLNGGLDIIGECRISDSVPDPYSIPFSLHIDIVDDWPTRELTISEFLVQKGNFKASKLPLHKFLSPFLFKNDSFQLRGWGDFEGTYDSNGLVVHYDAQQLVLENQDFLIEVPSLYVLGVEENPLPGVHFFDFQAGENYGSLPLYNADYYEKKSGLHFSQVRALVNLEKNRVHIPEIETYSAGIYFSGDLDIDWSMPGDDCFDVNLHVGYMSGKFSQVQQFFSHFDKSLFFLKLPLEGEAMLREKGAFIKLMFAPENHKMDLRIQGVVADGVMDFPEANLSVQELCLSFDYDQVGSVLNVSEMQGTILVGKSDFVEEYTFMSDKLRFNDYADHEGEFDLWIGDKKRDIIRLTGKTFSTVNENQEKILDISLDRKLSHFGEIHPKEFRLSLTRDWSQVRDFHLSLDFDVHDILQDLQKFSRTGLGVVSRHMLKSLDSLKKTEGSFNLALDYDSESSCLFYKLFGEDLYVDDYYFQKCLLNGRKKGNAWMIDQLQLDQYFLAADLLAEEGKCKINFLGVRLGQALLIGLEGMYVNESNVLSAQINLFESDLSALPNLPLFDSFIASYQPEGKIKGSGKLNIEFVKGTPGYRAELLLQASVKGAKFKQIHLEDAEHFSIEFFSDKSLIVSHLNTALLSSNDKVVVTPIKIDRIEFNVLTNEFSISKLNFDVPSENLNDLRKELQRSFPETISKSMGDLIANLKKTDHVVGNIYFDLSSPYYSLKIHLLDGLYSFFGKEHEINHLTLSIDPFEMNALAQYRFEHHQFWVKAKSKAPNFDHGELVLSDVYPDQYRTMDLEPALTIQWEDHPEYGWLIHNAEGVFAGIQVSLIRNEAYPLLKEYLALRGNLQFDFSRAVNLFPFEIGRELLDWELGKGYSLEGEWIIGKDPHISGTDQITFTGKMTGKNFELAGYQFQYLTAAVEYAPEKIAIKDLIIKDDCGSLETKEIFLRKAGGVFSVSLPRLFVQNFRPSLLNDGSDLEVKPLILSSLILENFHGILGNKNSFVGKGELVFSNTSKKNTLNTIFAIPSEIISRIGLNLSVLTPVTGTITYSLKEGRIILTRFKDMYSESKRSKFYLPHTPYESYVEFNGSLNVQVKMKQYNLLFKLAELFTVTIKGNLKKPTYTLQKQNRRTKDAREAVVSY